MTAHSKSLRLVWLVVLLAAMLAVSGCFATQEQSASTSTGAVEPSPQMGAPSPDGGMASRDAAVTEEKSLAAPYAQGGAGTGERLIVRNAALSLRVDDIDKSLAGVRAVAKAQSAEIADLQVYAGADGGVVIQDASGQPSGPANATITLRVPAEKLGALRTALVKLGTVTSESESASDVTEQAIDMEARLKNLRAQEAQLRQFFEKATKVSDLLAIEQELARVRGEIEAMDAQLTYLQRQAARATLTLSLTEPAPVVSPAGSDWGIREALTAGFRGAALVITTFITIAIALMPLALVVVAVWLIVRSRRRRRATRIDEQQAAAPESREGGDSA